MAADKKRIKIGFLGMGTVGQGVWKHLLESRDRMTARMGVEYDLGPVGVRGIAKKRSVEIPRNLLTDNLAEIVEDPQVDIVCELMGGTSDALNLTLRALERGKTVVSANKALICEHGSEIFAAARANGGRYFFEASVAGGIPVIKILREGLVANEFSSIYGILNGTCNYILTRMERENAPFEDIIADARRLGYVEADESLDIDGIDSAHKIAVLTWLAHGIWIKPDSMILEGIRGVRLEDMLWARDNGYRIKLVASVRKIGAGGEISVSVCPTLVPLANVLANVNEVYNAVSLTGDVVGKTVHIGRGAGQDATASAVIADICDAVRMLCGGGALPLDGEAREGARLASLGDVEGEFYLRLGVVDQAGVLAAVASTLAKSGISIELLEQNKHSEEGMAWLLLTTHITNEAAMASACADLQKLPHVCTPPFMLRILRQ